MRVYLQVSKCSVKSLGWVFEEGLLRGFVARVGHPGPGRLVPAARHLVPRALQPRARSALLQLQVDADHRRALLLPLRGRDQHAALQVVGEALLVHRALFASGCGFRMAAALLLGLVAGAGVRDRGVGLPEVLGNASGAGGDPRSGVHRAGALCDGAVRGGAGAGRESGAAAG